MGFIYTLKYITNSYFKLIYTVASFLHQDIIKLGYCLKIKYIHTHYNILKLVIHCNTLILMLYEILNENVKHKIMKIVNNYIP